MSEAENAVDREIVEYCRLQHWPTTRHHAYNIAGRRATKGQESWPDRIVTIPGIGNVLVEVKQPGAKPSKGQRDRIAEIEAAGGMVIVADGLDVFIHEVDKLKTGRKLDYRTIHRGFS